MEGDVTANYIVEQLSKTNVRLTRPARGLPAGSQVEYAATTVLTDAIKGRQSLRSKQE